MQAFETDATIGPDGDLTLEQLPFSGGQTVHVRIEPKEAATGSRGRVLGLHHGLITMSDDFDDPLPDAFWLGNGPLCRSRVSAVRRSC